MTSSKKLPTLAGQNVKREKFDFRETAEKEPHLGPLRTLRQVSKFFTISIDNCGSLGFLQPL